MFPRNQYKDVITLFTPYIDNMTNQVRFFRKTLTRCFWNQDSIAVNRSGGTAAPIQVNLNIPLAFNPGYISRSVWVITAKMDLPNYWTIRLGADLESTIILRGDIEYPSLEKWWGIEEIGRAGSALRNFNNEFGTLAHRPSNCDEIIFGLASMHRITVAC